VCIHNTARAATAKSQALNPKQIEVTKYKFAKQGALGFGDWNFKFGNRLRFVAWFLRILARRAPQ
jgi:hypothetical protein